MAAPTTHLKLLLLVCFMVTAAMVAVDQVQGRGVERWESLPVEPPGKASKQSVRIRNELPSGTLLVHCRDKNHDLQVHYLPPGGEYYFDFRLNFWGTTDYWCHFNYGPVLWQQFDVWTGPGLSGLKKWPCDKCLWVVRLDGFYRAKDIPGGIPIIEKPWRQDH